MNPFLSALVRRLARFTARAPIFIVVGLGASPLAADTNADQAEALGKYLGQHGYGSIKVDVTDDNRQIVQAKIDGREVSLVVDTGCGRTCLSARCARHLELAVQPSKGELWGVGGMIQGPEGTALVKSFTLRSYEINRTSTIEVLSKDAEMHWDTDGLLGFDYLHDNAVILPVGAPFFLFKPGAGPVASIDRYMGALGFKAVPLKPGKAGLTVTGQVNGKPLQAIVDCGAALSTFDLDYVEKTLKGHDYTLPMYSQGVDGAHDQSYGFMASTMTLGTLPVAPMDMQAIKSPSYGRAGFNLLLGYDFLARHQAIIDLGTETLWMK